MENIKYPESAIETEIARLEAELNASFQEMQKMHAAARARTGKKPELGPQVPAILGDLTELLGEDDPGLQELLAETRK